MTAANVFVACCHLANCDEAADAVVVVIVGVAVDTAAEPFPLTGAHCPGTALASATVGKAKKQNTCRNKEIVSSTSDSAPGLVLPRGELI